MAEIIPTLRGIVHLNSALVLPSAVFMVHQYATERQWRYLFPLSCAMEFQLTMSALLHTVNRKNQWFRRLDHVAIFISLYSSSEIMGYFAPTPYTAASQIVLVTGVFQKLLRRDIEFSGIDRVVAIASCAIWAATVLKQKLPPQIKKIFCWVLGNFICMITFHALKWPKRDNRVFGYHEIMHTLSIVNLIIGYFTVLKH